MNTLPTCMNVMLNKVNITQTDKVLVMFLIDL